MSLIGYSERLKFHCASPEGRNQVGDRKKVVGESSSSSAISRVIAQRWKSEVCWKRSSLASKKSSRQLAEQVSESNFVRCLNPLINWESCKTRGCGLDFGKQGGKLERWIVWRAASSSSNGSAVHPPLIAFNFVIWPN
uniref:Uncharacterized protein n=1 Tax=Solanum tuberosum TaxID=4113 RepID=M1DAF2_SOLTU